MEASKNFLTTFKKFGNILYTENKRGRNGQPSPRGQNLCTGFAVGDVGIVAPPYSRFLAIMPLSGLKKITPRFCAALFFLTVNFRQTKQESLK